MLLRSGDRIYGIRLWFFEFMSLRGSYEFKEQKTNSWFLKIGPLAWDTFDCSLSYSGTALFCLRCAYCAKPTIGCNDHWFCGMCQMCKTKVGQAVRETS